MYKKTLSALSFSLLIVCVFLSSCLKEKTTDNTEQCAKLSQLHAHSFIPVTKDAEIKLSADSLNGAVYQWTGPGSFGSYDQNPTVTFYADYSNRGWYYVTISLDGCNDRFDSVYVNVKFPQGTAACSPVNNTATFGGPLILGNQSYSFISFGMTSTGYGITCNSTNGDLHLTLSPYWETHDFEDGIYYTTSNALPDYADIDKVFISDVNQSIYWVAEPDKPVYISHVGGKPRVTFCNILFSGDWGGTLYHTTVAGQVTKP